MTDLTPAVTAEGERRAKAREDAWVRFLNDDSDESTYTQACDAFGTWAAENFAALITAARERDALLAKVVWQDPNAAPSLAPGGEGYFIVAVRRAHDGNVWTFPATYVRDFPLEYLDEPYSRMVTGWFTAESNGDDAAQYEPLIRGSDEFVGWRHIEPHPLQIRPLPGQEIARAALETAGE